MSMTGQFALFAAYNRLMNQRIFDAAARLSDADFRDDRGAFFKSVLGTLNHILVGDIIWLKRFAAHPGFRKPLEPVERVDLPAALDAILFENLEELRGQREKIDGLIIDWVAGLTEADLGAYLAYRNMAGEPQNKRIESLVSHLFLHQVHHRGQATTLLSQSGVDFGDTDILEILDDYPA